MIQRREIAISIILTIFTCGIYGIFWFISLSDDIKKASGDESLPSGGIAFLLTLVTCGIYGFYWAYRMGKALSVAQTRAGFTVTNDNSILYLILQLFGLGIVNYALMQNQLNLIAEQGGGAAPQQPGNGGNGGYSAPQQPAAPSAPATTEPAPASQPEQAEPVVTETVEETTVVTEE